MKLRKLIIPVFAAILCSCITAHADFVIEPFIQGPTATTVTLFWETATRVTSLVTYGPGTSGEYTLSKKGPAALKHRVTLEGLEPGTLYYYRVVSGNAATPDGDNEYFFNTASNPGEPFVFAAFGDTRNGLNSYDANHEAVINSINAFTMPLFCLTMGDMVDIASDKTQWYNFFKIENPLLRHSAIYPVYGDNDLLPEGYSFDDYFNMENHGRWYSFDWGGCHFIALHSWHAYEQASSELNPESEQYKWLVKDLASRENSTAHFTIVFMHTPIYLHDRVRNKVTAKYWHPLFKKYGVDLVLSSGEHLYQRSMNDGIRHIVSGGGGAEIQSFYSSNLNCLSIADFHHCRISVNFPVLTIEAVNVIGNILDRISIVSDVKSGNGSGPEKEPPPGSFEIKTYEQGTGKASKEVNLTLFSSNCVYCKKIEDSLLPSIAEKTGIVIKARILPLSVRENFEKLISLENDYSDTGNELPAVFIGNRILGGEKEISENLEEMIKTHALASVPGDNTGKVFIDAEKHIIERFKIFRAVPIFTSGLLNSLEPCTYTVIIFLLAYLTLMLKRNPFNTGMLFTAALFLANFTVSLGGFSGFLASGAYRNISTVLHYIIAAVVLLTGIYIFRNAIKNPKTTIAFSLDREIKNKPRIIEIAAPLAAGFIVSFFELACSGQYLPVLQYAAVLPSYRVMSVVYILIYNIAFSLPFLALAAGFRFVILRLNKNNTAILKKITAILFVILGILIAVVF